jgi:hypothetical protein
MAKFEQGVEFKSISEEEKTSAGRAPEKFKKIKRDIQFEPTIKVNEDDIKTSKFKENFSDKPAGKKILEQKESVNYMEKYKELIEDIKKIVEGEGLEISESELEEISEEEAREIAKRAIPPKPEKVTNTILALLEQNKIGEIEDEGEKIFLFNAIYRLVRRKLGEDVLEAYNKSNLIDARNEEDKKRREKILADELSNVGDKYDMADILDYFGSDLTITTKTGGRGKIEIE